MIEEQDSTASVIVIIVSALAATCLPLILVICVIILCLRLKMRSINTIHSDQSSVESPSLRKKADAEDGLPTIDSSATVVPVLEDPDLWDNELEEAKMILKGKKTKARLFLNRSQSETAEDLHQLNPRGKRPKAARSLKRSQSEIVSQL